MGEVICRSVPGDSLFMLYYLVKVKIVGSGNLCFKNNTKIPSVKWSSFREGGFIFKFGDDCYSFKAPKIPHFLFWYYEKYHVEYIVWERGSNHSFSWKRFLSLKHLHIEEGDIVIDENNNEKYLMVINPSTSKIDHHRLFALNS